MVEVVSGISKTTGVGTFPNNGVTEFELPENTPVPIVFLAATLNTYAVPLVKPVTVTEVEVDTPSENVVKVEPLSLEYWTT
jgi:hypothetical protein